MNKEKILTTILFIIFTVLLPELACAQIGFGGGGTFESKLSGLQNALVGTLLPFASTVGLIWAAVLAATGSGEGIGKAVTIVVMSIIGFMAQYIIQFFQGIAS